MVQSIQSNLKQTYNRQCWLFRLNLWENIINLIMLVYEQRSVINNAIATMYLYFRFFFKSNTNWILQFLDLFMQKT